MTFYGILENGAIVLDSAPPLPEGTRVEVEVKPLAPAASPLGEMLLRHAGRARGLPEDMAAQHDRYIRGTPKRAMSR